MNKTWIYEQTELNVLQRDLSMETHYPESGKWLRQILTQYFMRHLQNGLAQQPLSN